MGLGDQDARRTRWASGRQGRVPLLTSTLLAAGRVRRLPRSAVVGVLDGIALPDPPFGPLLVDASVLHAAEDVDDVIHGSARTLASGGAAYDRRPRLLRGGERLCPRVARLGPDRRAPRTDRCHRRRWRDRARPCLAVLPARRPLGNRVPAGHGWLRSVRDPVAGSSISHPWGSMNV